MRSDYRWILVAIVAAVLVLPAPVAVEQPDEGGRVFASKDWPFVGGDWTSARYSTLGQINVQTVRNLSGAWRKRFGAGASTRATPVVKDGLLIIPAGALVHGLNAKTGETVWTWPASAKESNAAPRSPMASIAGEELPNVAGVAVAEGLVFVGLRDGRVAALSQNTGELVWTERTGDVPRKKGESIAAAPIYARGIVFAGLANGDWALRGRVVALDAKTGKKRWNFFTVPAPGEPGHESWPKDNDSWTTGGGGVWLVGTVDVELGMVYFVTGNAVPMFGGELRKGDNLFTASVLALEMTTGKLRWYYQVVHHDLWDADIATPVVLYDTPEPGRPRKGLAALRADGYLFLLDRETGKPIFPVEERPVTQDAFLNTAPTQPFPVGADSLLPDCAWWKPKVPPPFVVDCSGFPPPFLDKHQIVAPGVPIPRVRVTPMAYSPQTGYFYAQGVGHVGRARRFTDDPWFQGAGGDTVTLPEAIGILAAIDSRTNKIVWKKEVPAALIGTSGPLTTAGGLMVRGAGDGRVEAYDAKTGERLWEFQTGIRSARGPAATYSVDGEQYIALAMGTELWAFKLGGTIPSQPAPVVSPAGSVSAGAETEEIETATLRQVSFGGAVGRRYAVDEHAFNPPRARVKVGTRVMLVNNGRVTHTLAARDGSWNSGVLAPAKSYYVQFDKPGTHIYHCTVHPWAIGQVTVEQ